MLRDDTPRADVGRVGGELAREHGGRLLFTYTHALKGFSVRLPEAAAVALSGDARVAYIAEGGEVRAFATQFNPPSWGLTALTRETFRSTASTRTTLPARALTRTRHPRHAR